MDDDELVASVAGGDDGALRELYARHAPWIAMRLRSMLPGSDVEDVLQETFVAVWRASGGYRPAGNGGGWLWGIARRRAALWLRQRGPAALSVPPDFEPGDDAPDPADLAAWRTDLRAAVAALGPPGSPEREVVRLLYIEDRSVTEVAAVMGTPEGTVKSRAHRARRLLWSALRGGSTANGGAR
jgi:RNA polymerase sigma-70 factor (ECF subfamily)